ncbi:hypothetical protein L7F22_063264 [Adiantum nelumboides]|nr:hypothetical protein [Adiantum nelumboides]
MGFFFGKKKDEETEQDDSSLQRIIGSPHEKTWQERWEQYKLEDELRPDYTKLPGVEKEVKRSPYFTDKPPSSPEAIDREKRIREELPKSEIFQLLLRAQRKQKKKNEEAIARNSRPYRPEDTKLWQSLPHVPHPASGLPMPRMAIKTFEQGQATFWDFFKQFHFGLWGYRQRPYPIEKPNDIQQMLGYKWLDKRYADCKSVLAMPIISQ